MVKCKSQQISELIERNEFLNRQLENTCKLIDALDITEAIVLNEKKIEELKGGKFNG